MVIFSQCKRCRRANQKLFLKGERCFSQKCAMVKRPYIPGLHGHRRRTFRSSEYGQQLMEKQKVRYTYGLSEKQFRKYFEEITVQKGDKIELFLRKLETRLDNVIFRLGWASSRRQARQIVSHGHILVNNRRVDIPSYELKKGNIIKIKTASKKTVLFDNLKTNLKKYKAPTWLSLDKDKLEAKMINWPKTEEAGKIGDMAMIIEYYSR